MTKQVLIVDDDDHLRELVQACLEDLGGWKTLTASSGKEALKITETQPVDAILLDVSMPDMDGFVVFEKLQENTVSQSIPVILLTARVLPSDRDRFARMGIAGVISKPFEPIAISQQVADILGWD
ncbi:response regulator [Tolypothrix sp. PCC 7910]|uniref:response regulator n=1 Tax=Tolypothrix sp. PCC 7910 TaxID=2099387 RepID=UPI00142778D8|nr:response regulator [Tolypothrix sp. PCC 7910]QIR35742.1 response regulator [Tolypothrix sp. PCC 7910]